MLNAEPVVAPLMLNNTCVVDAVIDELVIVNVRSAAAAIDTDVNVARPDLPFTTTGDAAAPDAEGEFNSNPAPAVELTKLPVAVNVVAETGLGVVLPNPKTGGEAKSSAVAACAVAGVIATLSISPAAASV